MITSVILTKNEEKNIDACIKSLLWCNEVLLIDDYSTDSTVKIAKKHGARVYKRHLDNDFSAQRNFGLKKAKGEWVLFVDADERVSSSLSAEVIKVPSYRVNCNGFYIKRLDVIWGRELRHGETGNTRLLRLAKKGAGEWKRKVHEVWDIQGETETLDSPLLHYPHASLREFISSIDNYSTIDADVKLKEGIKSNLLKIILWPLFKFILNWILRFGFMDGIPGLLVAVMMSMHSYSSWSKLWLLQRKTRN